MPYQRFLMEPEKLTGKKRIFIADDPNYLLMAYGSFLPGIRITKLPGPAETGTLLLNLQHFTLLM